MMIGAIQNSAALSLLLSYNPRTGARSIEIDATTQSSVPVSATDKVTLSDAARVLLGLNAAELLAIENTAATLLGRMVGKRVNLFA